MDTEKTISTKYEMIERGSKSSWLSAERAAKLSTLPISVVMGNRALDPSGKIREMTIEERDRILDIAAALSPQQDEQTLEPLDA